MSLTMAHQSNEKAKKREYNQRILEIEHGTFSPLVFSCYGGMAKECSAFFKRLALMIAERREEKFSDVSEFIRTKISFSLIRMAISFSRVIGLYLL